MKRISPRIFFGVLLFLCAAGLYAASLGNGFTFLDDGLLIYQNNIIREISFRTISAAFTSYDPEIYIPLTFLSYQIDYLIGGLHPFMYHLTNLLLHAGSAVLVMVIVRMLTKGGMIAAFLADLLFAVHPLHVEAVAWAAARKDVLSGFLFLVTFLLYIVSQDIVARRSSARHSMTSDRRSSDERPSFERRATNRRATVFYVGSIVTFLLALLAKVSVIPLPLILLLVDWYQGRNLKDARVWIGKIPFFLLSLLFGVIALGGKAGIITEDVTPLQHLLLACKMTAVAILKIILPFKLSLFYPELQRITLLNPSYLFSVLFIITIAVLVIHFRRVRIIPFAALFFLLMLAPAFFTVVKGGGVYFFSERYAYLPSIGIIVLVCHFMTHRRMIQILIALALIFSVFTVHRSLQWGDNLVLFGDVVKRYPAYHLGRVTYGALLIAQKRHADAIDEFRAALVLKPLANTYGPIGQAQAESGDMNAALASFREGLMMDPDDAELHYGLGQLHALRGESDLALAEFERALALSPKEESRYSTFARTLSARRDKILLHIGILFGERGDHGRALSAYGEGLQENPFNADLHFNTGVSLGYLGNIAGALAAYERAVETDPTHVPARINLGLLSLQLGNRERAREQFDAVLKMEPGNVKAQEALRQLGG